MEFACVRDCSRCPFSCFVKKEKRSYYNNQNMQNTSNNLPEALQIATKENLFQNRIETVVDNSDENKDVVPINQNSITISDIDYEVHDAKKTLFGWRKK